MTPSKYYECVKCQRLHFAPSYLFDLHIMNQSKRGLMYGDSPADVFAKWISRNGATSVVCKNAYRVEYIIDGITWYAARIHPNDDEKFPPHWTIHKQGLSGPSACYRKIYDSEMA